MLCDGCMLSMKTFPFIHYWMFLFRIFDGLVCQSLWLVATVPWGLLRDNRVTMDIGDHLALMCENLSFLGYPLRKGMH